jgi:hypothetical protein
VTDCSIDIVPYLKEGAKIVVLERKLSGKYRRISITIKETVIPFLCCISGFQVIFNDDS